MIIDFSRTVAGNNFLTVSPPLSALLFSVGTDSYDMASGEAVANGWFPGDGEPLFMRFEVTTAFTTATNAVANFFWCMSENPNPAIGTFTTPIAFSGGWIRLTTGAAFGMQAAALTVGATITMPLTGFDPSMHSELVNFQALRYLGIGVQVVNHLGPANFTAGVARAFITKLGERDRTQRYITSRFRVT
jgi:hypothetical protein